jgi:hypothetical protein
MASAIQLTLSLALVLTPFVCSVINQATFVIKQGQDFKVD